MIRAFRGFGLSGLNGFGSLEGPRAGAFGAESMFNFWSRA